MTSDEKHAVSRREEIAAAGVASVSQPLVAAASPAGDFGKHDFDFLMGRWTVAHRRLKDRLVHSTEWLEFEGTCEAWPTLGGLGNVDDNLLNFPDAPYRAMSIRKYSTMYARWSIWWLDGRLETLDPPVRGSFVDGTGLFLGADVFRGKPVDVRFRWTGTRSGRPRWEQAFSPDGGSTWETNWIMEFQRAA